MSAGEHRGPAAALPGLPDPDFVNRLVPLSEDEIAAAGWAVDLAALPAPGEPVLHRHVVEVSPETEQALHTEATRLGITVDALIRARIEHAA